MIDSGASTSFLNWRFVKRNNVTTKKLTTPIPLRNADDSKNAMGAITHTAQLQLIIGQHCETINFAITDIGTDEVIMGIDWLRYHNPDINWREGQIQFKHYPPDCNMKRNKRITFKQTHETQAQKMDVNKVTIEAAE